MAYFNKIMRTHLVILASVAALCIGYKGFASSDAYDVFIPIAKYIRQGDAEKLSAWFADNLEVSIMSSKSDCSRDQARQIVKSFFNAYTPRSFEITHTAGRDKMKYAIGSMNAGGAAFEVTIFVSYKQESYRIQQFKIEKID